MRILRLLLPIIAVFFAATVSAKEIPMWEGVGKTPAQKAADRQLIDTIEKTGRKEQAVRRAIQLGWQYIAKKNPEMAMKRFNQAWLLSPEHPDVHWGFAVATHYQNRPLSVVERHFKKAESLKPNDPALFSDHGRALQERNRNRAAIRYFRKALAISPNHRDAHVGMWMASKALGDLKTAEKHLKRVQ